jgi:hypothetical protein
MTAMIKPEHLEHLAGFSVSRGPEVEGPRPLSLRFLERARRDATPIGFAAARK